MKIKNTIKSSIYAMGAYFIMCLFTLLLRKLFVMYLPIEFLGYEGLFGNVFALLSMADLGIETLIIYRLYAAFAENNEEKISEIINIYRSLYKFVGTFVFIVGLFLLPCLPWIIKGNILNWKYLYVIYIVQLSTSLSTYFLGYKRLLYIITQREYICQSVDTICFLGACAFRIVCIIVFRSYILYLVIGLCNNVIGNVYISQRVNREFKYVKAIKPVSISYLKRNGYFKDIKNNLFQKVASVIYGGTDNILVSAFLDIAFVGLMSNYLLISGYITTAVDKILHPFQAAIGNLLHSKETADYDQFIMFDTISFFIAIVISTEYFIVFDNFIYLWLGESYILPIGFLIFFVCNQYVLWNHKFLTYYRYSYGSYEIDRNCITLGAILNVVCSILFIKHWGLAGVMLGTVIGHIGFWVGRAKVVFKVIFPDKKKEYILRQLYNLLIFALSLCISLYITSFIEYSIMGLIGRLILAGLLPILIASLFLMKTKGIRIFRSYATKVIKQVRR